MKEQVLCWEDYFGQDVAEFSKLSYIDRNGVRQYVDIADDIEAQIEELKRTVGGKLNLRVYNRIPG